MPHTSTFKSVNKSEKVSDGIIAQIRDAILSGELKPGDKLASEKELITEFGVSKATMREALRVLEAMGLLEIRKGIAGGAFVAEVSMRTTIHGILNFLHFQPVSISEITLLRYLLEPTVAQIAAVKRTEGDIQKLRDILSEASKPGQTELSMGITFHRYLARITKNPLLILVIDFVDGYLSSLKIKLNLGADFYERVQKAHETILECLIQGDPVAAGIAAAQDILEVDRYMSRQANSYPFDPSDIVKYKQRSDMHLMAYPGAHVVTEDDPAFQKKGAILRRVGSGKLYVLLEGDNFV
jgi:GntR family transcriptional repressor for pyruvate dehydrogenase complex